MKKLYYSAFTYLIIGLISGVTWRELTKILDVAEPTALGTVHTHLLVLGFVMFLIFMIFEKLFQISKTEKFTSFFVLYHVGVALSSVMMFIRGFISMQEIRGALNLSNGLNSAISGVAGIGHMILAVGLILFMLVLKERLFGKKQLN